MSPKGHTRHFNESKTMIRPIVLYPDPGLRTPSTPIVSFDRDLKQLASDMVETMYAAPGIGLAAPQVGVNQRLILVDLSVGAQSGELYTAVNPEIIDRSGTQTEEEGCLSIPDVTECVTRPERIVLRAQDLNGEKWEIEAEGLLARCFLHEVDHIDGILFIDRLSPLKRNVIKRKLKKMAKVAALSNR